MPIDENEHRALVARVESLANDVKSHAAQLAELAEEQKAIKASVSVLRNYDLEHHKNIQLALQASEDANRAAADALAMVRTAMVLRKEFLPSE